MPRGLLQSIALVAGAAAGCVAGTALDRRRRGGPAAGAAPPPVAVLGAASIAHSVAAAAGGQRRGAVAALGIGFVTGFVLSALGDAVAAALEG